MRIAIVDDQIEWRTKVEKKVKRYAWKEDVVIDQYACGEEFCTQTGYDIVFMDIDMGKMDGFDAVHIYKENNLDAIIVFLTSHTELSRKGYLVNAFRYVDKANMDEELEEALVAIDLLRSRNHVIVFHVVNVGEMNLKIKDILFIETEKRNVIIHTSDEAFLSNRKIDELEEQLSEWGFFRCHKSYLVNLGNIKSFDRLNVCFSCGKKALVSTRKYSELKDKYLEQKFKMANS